MNRPSIHAPGAPAFPAVAPAAGGDGRSSRWESHRRERRLELVKTARRAVHRLGPGAAMEDIAAEAATSKSVFYRYFGDKDGLRRSMGEVVVGQLRGRVLEAARHAEDEERGLRAMVAAYLNMAQSSPNVYFFVTAAGRGDSPAPGDVPAGAAGPLDDFFAELTSMMGERLDAYVAARGGAGADTAASRLWPRAAIGMVRAAGESWLAQPPGPDRPGEEELTETITRWLVHGISRGRPADTAGTTAAPTIERPGK